MPHDRIAPQGNLFDANGLIVEKQGHYRNTKPLPDLAEPCQALSTGHHGRIIEIPGGIFYDGVLTDYGLFLWHYLVDARKMNLRDPRIPVADRASGTSDTHVRATAPALYGISG